MKNLFLFCVSILLVSLALADSIPEGCTINDGAEIKFRDPLPAMNVAGRHNGTYNNYEMGLPALLTTTDPKLGEMIHQLRNTIQDDRRLVFIDGKVLMCSNNWIRDHVQQMKGFLHWEYDLDSFLNFILETQRADGCFYELIKQLDDPHWKFVDADCRVLYPEDNLSLVRLEIEADVEYLVVEGAMRYYQVTGDDVWLARVLPKLEKAIDYMTSDPKRWDPERGLVKRGFTIDTWDFTYKPDAGTNRRINDQTPMGIMHGDCTGVYQAMNQLAWFHDRLGNSEKAKEWLERAETLKASIFQHLWNGKFFIHQIGLNGAGVDDQENVRLSLSNAYALNRGILNVEQARSIIGEYLARRETTKAFAEWFSIDPPYTPAFGNCQPGQYVNGGISPFTAGELAKGAFRNGYEAYGWDILRRFEEMIKEDKAIYFLYDPATRKPLGGGPSAWGAAALLSAIDEGLAGITDLGTGYNVMEFAPRFPVTHYTETRYFTGYEKTAKFVDVRWVLRDEGMRYYVLSPAKELRAHLLLPKGKSCSRVKFNGQEQTFELVNVGESVYVDFVVKPEGKADLEVFF